MNRVLIYFVIVASLVGCRGPRVWSPSGPDAHSTFYPIAPLTLEPKTNAATVEVLTTVPSRTFVSLGWLALEGDGSASQQTLMDTARDKAAFKLGADFILIMKADVQQQMYMTPGVSSYHAFGTAYGSGFGNSWYANALYGARGYSVGPSVGTVTRPTMAALVGAYYPSRLGIEWSQGATNQSIVAGFGYRSKAQEAGIQVGDRILAIDGIELPDLRLPEHLMKVQPGQKVSLTILRDGKQQDVSVEMIPN